MKTARMKSGHVFGRRSPSGFVLLDAVIAILIFSIGILGMVALQGTAVKLAGDAKHRSDAAMLADQVIAQMWGDNLGVGSTFATRYAGSGGSGGSNYTAWAATLDCTSTTPSTGCLPGAAANPPTIAITQTTTPQGAPIFLATITVNWEAPNDAGPHNYVSITQISR
ncbi:hypothetical protein [Rhodanobacter sp. C03]|uniref:type IV pilus modification PilV family protein n=1 Tax=Rhodanobacter sp. C03 TaxID=1945858 RepID=UPI0009D02048|nr:hypothetical protein [Rhodanobacter sp. C03]OOG57271.1 hypothetical protein B0E48_07355 [Rhodanobacter sp. C03]